MQVSLRTGQCADYALRTYKVHYYELTRNCSSVVRKEANLGVGVVVAMECCGQHWLSVEDCYYRCFHL